MPAHGKRRALGQHFLRDKAIARLIAETAVAEAARAGCRALLEIGPGKGALTLPLLDALAAHPEIRELILAERDRELAKRWSPPFGSSHASKSGGETPGPPSGTLSPVPTPLVRVEEGDFVELPEERWLATTPLAVASNLPYSAGTAIVTRLARHVRDIPVMVLMFQAEVAHRLRAEPGTKAWGSLSIWIQNRWDVRKLCGVAPGAFSPPPDVQSEVVVLTRRKAPRVSLPADPLASDGAREAEALWESLLKAAFLHRRKMLRSGLPPSGILRNALELSGVDGTRRAEALTWEEWDRLLQAALGAVKNR